ncbi:ankyrin repeat-containing domain protein [Nemania sp. FL0916]|nr:ankyrin repeat-containing domain protein [Nemania sp. FL0916]
MASNEWERHEATIIYLFILENTPLKQVRIRMKEKHNFDKTIGQYEYQLKKWGIKKNANKDAFRYVAHRVNKRRGKQSEITIYGMPVSKARARRQIQRHTNIPTAAEIRARLQSQSPKTPEGMEICVATPPPMALNSSWPRRLPWFSFKERVLPTLRNPSGLLEALFDMAIKFKEPNIVVGSEHSSGFLWTHPLQLRRTVRHLSQAIPNDDFDRQLEPGALARNESHPCLATEMLKVIFFSLSNNLSSNYFGRTLDDHHQFLICLVRAVSSSNPEMLSVLFSGKCVTTRAIREAVYASALREKHYEILERLLQSGVSPDLRALQSETIETEIGQGKIKFDYMFETPGTGMCEAALTLDLRLAQIMLRAGANPIESHNESLQDIAASAGIDDATGDAVDFMQLLVNHGGRAGPSISRCSCGGVKINLSFGLAISNWHHHLKEFFKSQGAADDVSNYSDSAGCRCSIDGWFSHQFADLSIPCGPVEMALALCDDKEDEPLFNKLITCARQSSSKRIKHFLIISCLVGNTSVTSELLKLAGLHTIDLNSGWHRGITPLVASAWNLDTSIAKMLLDLGACAGPIFQENLFETTELCPIHIAAFYGNTELVKQLVARGADFAVRCARRSDESLSWLVPYELSTPLQFALESRCPQTINMFLSYLDLLSRDSSDETLVSDIVSYQPPGRLRHEISEREAFDSAIGAGSVKLVWAHLSAGQQYSSRALYLATWTAVQSKDYAICKVLVEHRPPRQIDSHEASALVLAIAIKHWDLVDLFMKDPFRAGPASSHYRSVDKINFSLDAPQDLDGFLLTPLSAAFVSDRESLIESMIQRGFLLQAQDVVNLMEGRVGNHKISSTVQTAIYSKLPLGSVDPEYLKSTLCRLIQLENVEKARECSELLRSLDIGIDYTYLLHISPMYPSMTPMGLAVAGGHLELVLYFIEAGANPDYTPPAGYNALEAAAECGNGNMMKLFLKQEGVVDQSSRVQSAERALGVAALKGNLVVMRLLIDWGVDVSAEWTHFIHGHVTALELAAIDGRLDAVHLLLETGPEINSPVPFYYVRAVKWAAGSGHDAIADHLKKYGSWTQEDQRHLDCLDLYYDTGRKIRRIEKPDYSDLASLEWTDHDSSARWALDSKDGSSKFDNSSGPDDAAELDNICENDIMALQRAPPGFSSCDTARLTDSIGRRTSGAGIADNYTTGTVGADEPAMATGVQSHDSDMLDMDITPGQSMSRASVCVGWEIPVSTPETNDAVNAQRDSPDHDMFDMNISCIDLSNEQTMPPSTAWPEWDWSPMGAGNFDTFDDLDLDFSTW